MPSYAGPPVSARQGDVASTLRLLAYLALTLCLIFLDHRGGWLSQVRAQANVLTQPLWWLAGLPGRVGTRVQDDAVSRGRLMEENRQLRNDLLIANARLTRLQTAASDNTKLRALLGVAESRGLDVQLAPILNIDLDPTRQRLVLDAGRREGVRMGQAVIDDGGLIGQIIGLTPNHSTVLLLTDADHAVPVVIARNGVRLIAYGRGRIDQLEIADIPLNTGVEVGDLIVTSGLGGRFPPGFPVGTVTTLRPDDSHAFLIAELRPAARLDRGRDVLLLRSAPPQPLPAATADPQASAPAGTPDQAAGESASAGDDAPALAGDGAKPTPAPASGRQTPANPGTRPAANDASPAPDSTKPAPAPAPPPAEVRR
ncbi:rod shape-determining protein MreC [Pseudoxanthomonas dokdonensis]|uniref:rod shape-determining protein MreC n=1 Tax=Pseudoxanthomonas dokdonensis TaxID=344882 RepID=UPI0009FB7AD6|nr:rod shape-determining protein MreC [Pseudoxanthomonas dokdonensis]